MNDKLSTGLVHLTLAVILITLALDSTSSAPLALSIDVPIDFRKPAVVRNRPLPASLPVRPDLIIPGQTSRTNDEGNGAKKDSGDNNDSGNLKFMGMDLPKMFGAYDLDQSRGVSLIELAAVTDTELKDAKEPFEAADTNGDNVLSPKEFTQAPWLFDAGGITLIDSILEPVVEDDPFAED